MAQSIPPPQIVIMLGKGGHCQGPKPECSVPPPLILHFNHWDSHNGTTSSLDNAN